jgi:D-cysteine desulfhydrase
LVTPEEYRDKDTRLETLAEELKGRGRSPYVIGEGCSVPIGVWGYIEAAGEIAEAERVLARRFGAYVHGCGSGGTTAGLELGARLHGLEGTVLAMAVCDDEAYFRDKVGRLVNDTIERWELGVPFEAGELHILDDYVGLGYGVTQPEELEVLTLLARSEGIILDPVYSGKAFYGLRNEIEAGRFENVRDVLFIHTGGIYGTMAYADQLAL